MFTNNRNKRGTAEGPAMIETASAAELPRPSGVPSIISTDMTISGNLKSPGRLQIEGTVLGDIEVGQLVVTDGAVIKGEINAQEVEISGALTGIIRANEVTLKSSARVTGDVYYEVLMMERGAELEGQCRLKANEAKAASPAPADAKISGFPHVVKDTPMAASEVIQLQD